MNKSQICCFTGHRPEILISSDSYDEKELSTAISNAVENAVLSGYVCFICGASRGADFMFGEAVAELRGQYPHIQLECAVPCRDQPMKWSADDRRRYAELLDSADIVTCLNSRYHRGCMHERNRYMVDRSSLLIAVYNGSPGGTEYTVKYARQHGLSVINLSNQLPEQVSFEESMQKP